MLENFATWFLVVCFLVLAVFQLALALNLSMGKLAFGGEYLGKLSNKYKAISVLGALVAIALAGHYLAEAGVFESLLPQDGRNTANWVFFIALFVASLISYLPRFKSDRALWSPIAVGMTASALIVAL
jgi:hypothetical protein